MPVHCQSHPPVYRHLILLVWDECDAEGKRVAWRFSLQESQKEQRIGFKNFDELKNYLEQWLEAPQPSEETNQNG